MRLCEGERAAFSHFGEHAYVCMYSVYILGCGWRGLKSRSLYISNVVIFHTIFLRFLFPPCVFVIFVVFILFSNTRVTPNYLNSQVKPFIKTKIDQLQNWKKERKGKFEKKEEKCLIRWEKFVLLQILEDKRF